MGPFNPATFGALTTGVTATSAASFATRPTSGTSTFRLLQAARTWTFNPAVNAADPTTDAGGGSVKVTWGPSGPAALNFTLGNTALGVDNQTIPTTTIVINNKDVHQVTLADGRILTVYVDTAFNSTTDFAWTAYGNWNITSSTGVPQNGASYVTGFETPTSGVPTTGTATFNGFVEGVALVPSGTAINGASLRGTAQLSVNWATGGITGAASNILATPGGTGATQTWNGLSFTGNVATGTSMFNGVTTVTGAPGTAFALTTGATGDLTGKFFGTTAQEVGAVWSAHDGVKGASGYLVAKQ